MRLSEKALDQIHELVASQLRDTEVWELRLFGSRLNDTARGGDVDLYLEVAGMDANERMQLKRQLRPALEELLDCPVDLVIQDRYASLKPVSVVARQQGQII